MDYIKDYLLHLKFIQEKYKDLPLGVTLQFFEDERYEKHINILKNICLVSDEELSNAYIKSKIIFENLDKVAQCRYANCIGDEWKLKDYGDVLRLTKAIDNLLYAPWVMSFLKNADDYKKRYENETYKWNPIKSYLGIKE